MQIIKKAISEMNKAEYNPRVELRPGDAEYERLRSNINKFGLVVPIIWNERTNNVVSGHQRLTVLENEGVTETYVSVVDLDDIQEKQLNIAMNKIGGDWDAEKLTELLDELAIELGDEFEMTGFTKEEREQIANDIEAMLDSEVIADELSDYKEVFNITLEFNSHDRGQLEDYVRDYGKEDLVEVILESVKGGI